ncbi:enoyl-CoA hydratase [Mycobacterium sp. PS03-16]|nr:enoyl-CoA hydratase [Mycobacterium sp. PS03-16]
MTATMPGSGEVEVIVIAQSCHFRGRYLSKHLLGTLAQ